MANSLPMLNLRSSGINIGPSHIQPFAQDQSCTKPASRCLAKATLQLAPAALPVERALLPASPGMDQARHGKSAASGQFLSRCDFRLTIKAQIRCHADNGAAPLFAAARQQL